MAKRAWIYCGTSYQVDDKKTQDLLKHKHHAIWCPPPPDDPSDEQKTQWPPPEKYPLPGDLLWLVWRKRQGAPVLLLGGGIIRKPPHHRFETTILWIDEDDPGIRECAGSLGYDTRWLNTAFLRLDNVTLPAGNAIIPLDDLHDINSGFNEAAAYEALLNEHVPLI